jgi:hypothetical protein
MAVRIRLEKVAPRTRAKNLSDEYFSVVDREDEDFRLGKLRPNLRVTSMPLMSAAVSIRARRYPVSSRWRTGWLLSHREPLRRLGNLDWLPERPAGQIEPRHGHRQSRCVTCWCSGIARDMLSQLARYDIVPTVNIGESAISK